MYEHFCKMLFRLNLWLHFHIEIMSLDSSANPQIEILSKVLPHLIYNFTFFLFFFISEVPASAFFSQNVQICTSCGLRGAVFGGTLWRKWVKEQQRRGSRDEGGEHQWSTHAHVHLQCLMNDEDNDWWYLGGLGENTWLVPSNTHTHTPRERSALVHVYSALWLRRSLDKTV